MGRNHQTGSAHVIVIVFIIVAILGGLGFVAWRSLSHQAPKSTPKPSATVGGKATADTSVAFTGTPHVYANFTMTVPASIDAPKTIKAVKFVDLSQPSSNQPSYELHAYYDNRRDVTVARIDGPLDSRMLSVADDRVYFVIYSESTGIYEVDSFSLDSPNAGATKLEGFTSQYIANDQFCSLGKCTPYPTQIQVVGRLVYFTHFSDAADTSTLSTYNLDTGIIKAISSKKITWTDFLVDVANDRVFYVTDGSNLYIAHSDGTSAVQLGGGLYRGTGFFTGYLSGRQPVFGLHCTYVQPSDTLTCDLSTFDYTTYGFVPVSQSAKDAFIPDATYILR